MPHDVRAAVETRMLALRRACSLAYLEAQSDVRFDGLADDLNELQEWLCRVTDELVGRKRPTYRLILDPTPLHVSLRSAGTHAPAAGPSQSDDPR